MIETMTECGPPITYQDVKDFENRLQVSLPAEYKQFLLQYNGGRPSPDMFPIEGLAGSKYGGIQVFFRIGGQFKTSTLDWNYTITERLPRELLPIASNGGGDLICVFVDGNRTGEVVYWDSHGDVTIPWEERIYHIADSFSCFLESMHGPPPGFEERVNEAVNG